MQHRFVPRGAAKKLFACRADEVLMSGPAGTGKSRACLEKLHMMCLLNPGMRALIVRQVAASLASSAIQTYEKLVAIEALVVGIVTPFGGSLREPPGYKYSNGSFIGYGGLDKPTKIMSTEYDVIYVQEAIELTLTGWEALTTRLRNGRVSFQQLMADTNPEADTHFLLQRCNAGTTTLLESRHEDNPRYFDDAGLLTIEGRTYMARLDNLTGIRKERLRYGKWVGAEGIIYDEYDAAVHLVDRFDIPASWPRYWVIDFGFTNPFVCQQWAQDPDGRLFLYREFYFTGKTVDEHVVDILDAVSEPDPDYVHPVDVERLPHHGRKWTEPKPELIIADHDAEDRATFTKYIGLSTVPAKKTVSDGIQAVQRRLRRAGDGKPRLFFLKNSLVRRDAALVAKAKPTCTPEEIVRYVWDVVEGKVSKEQPRKVDDHGMDTTRYMVAHKDLQGEFNIRFID